VRDHGAAWARGSRASHEIVGGGSRLVSCGRIEFRAQLVGTPTPTYA
jgi:hypothetical protein